MTYNGGRMKLVLLAYVAVVALALTLKPAPASQGPKCGPGVLCIRTQRQVDVLLKQAPRSNTDLLAVR